MRILLVEDDAVLHQVVRQSLQDAGHRVDSARTLRDANHIWSVQPFDAVLLDLNLPDGSGLGALHAARARNDSAAVIVLTARNRTDERVMGLDARLNLELPDGYITVNEQSRQSVVRVLRKYSPAVLLTSHWETV